MHRLSLCLIFMLFMRNMISNIFPVFMMQVYPDPVRVVAIGKNVEELLADPDNESWLSISSELCGGQYIFVMAFTFCSLGQAGLK